MKKLKSIIWDWNGTLLDDVDVCLESINVMLSVRGLNQLSEGAYKEMFTFPVKAYYERAGFNFTSESFDHVAVEFIDLYREKLDKCGIFRAATLVLDWFSVNGYAQYLVSAMEHQFLLKSVQECGIHHYFQGISGITDHFANGKETMAREFIDKMGIVPADAVFIGDTLHDYEVASSLGMNCLLVANGHQSEQRLTGSGCDVVKDLSEVVGKFINGSDNNNIVK